MGSGHVNKDNRFLFNLIHEGKARPSFLVSHQLSFEEASEAYRRFDSRERGWTTVLPKPTA